MKNKLMLSIAGLAVLFGAVALFAPGQAQPGPPASRPGLRMDDVVPFQWYFSSSSETTLPIPEGAVVTITSVSGNVDMDPGQLPELDVVVLDVRDPGFLEAYPLGLQYNQRNGISGLLDRYDFAFSANVVLGPTDEEWGPDQITTTAQLQIRAGRPGVRSVRGVVTGYADFGSPPIYKASRFRADAFEAQP